MEMMNVAVVQMTGGEDKVENLRKALDFVDRAADNGADLAIFPEFFNFMGRKERYPAAAETIPGPTTEALQGAARKRGIALLCGSIPEIGGTAGKVRNTSVFVAQTGEILARYSKIHLFDIDVPGQVTSLESDYVDAGREIVTFTWQGITFGLSICYDLRFPELYRRLMQAGAKVILVPAAFTRATGMYHWDTLIRARAIENQVFVCAANQWGENPNWHATYGHSAVIDPWGQTLCRIPDGENLAVAELDMRHLWRIRSESPILTHIRPWLL